MFIKFQYCVLSNSQADLPGKEIGITQVSATQVLEYLGVIWGTWENAGTDPGRVGSCKTFSPVTFWVTLVCEFWDFKDIRLQLETLGLLFNKLSISIFHLEFSTFIHYEPCILTSNHCSVYCNSSIQSERRMHK